MTIHEFLQGDKFALLAGVELLETGNGYAKARMLIKPEHLNGGGVCQGGAIFTLADLAFAAATNSHARLTLSITSNSLRRRVRDIYMRKRKKRSAIRDWRIAKSVSPMKPEN